MYLSQRAGYQLKEKKMAYGDKEGLMQGITDYVGGGLEAVAGAGGFSGGGG